MKNDYKVFLKECIKNRKFLEFTYQDMSNCLTNVSVDDYANFEKGQFSMSKDNLIRITRVLCIEKPVIKDIEDYIDVDGLTEDEINDLTKVVAAIVGDENA
jgi:hypothetical protein